MTPADERDPSTGALGGDPTDAVADVAVDVDEPEELLLDPVLEPDGIVLPEQWEVLADAVSPPAADPSVTDPPVVAEPPAGPSVNDRPVVAEPPVAVPVLHHVVEAEVDTEVDTEVDLEQQAAVEPDAEPEPEPESELEPELEQEFVFAPMPEPEPEFVFAPVPEPEPEPEPEPAPESLPVVAEATGPLEVVEPAAVPAAGQGARPRRGLDAEIVPPTERATSAMVLLLLAVVVGIAVAGLVSAVVLVVTLVVRRALGA